MKTKKPIKKRDKDLEFLILSHEIKTAVDGLLELVGKETTLKVLIESHQYATTKANHSR